MQLWLCIWHFWVSKKKSDNSLMIQLLDLPGSIRIFSGTWQLHRCFPKDPQHMSNFSKCFVFKTSTSLKYLPLHKWLQNDWQNLEFSSKEHIQNTIHTCCRWNSALHLLSSSCHLSWLPCKRKPHQCPDVQFCCSYNQRHQFNTSKWNSQARPKGASQCMLWISWCQL